MILKCSDPSQTACLRLFTLPHYQLLLSVSCNRRWLSLQKTDHLVREKHPNLWGTWPFWCGFCCRPHKGGVEYGWMREAITPVPTRVTAVVWWGGRVWVGVSTVTRAGVLCACGSGDSGDEAGREPGGCVTTWPGCLVSIMTPWRRALLTSWPHGDTKAYCQQQHHSTRSKGSPSLSCWHSNEVSLALNSGGNFSPLPSTQLAG